MDLGIITFFSALLISILNLTVALRGQNVCTQIQSVVHIDRIPTGGIMTSTIRYTTRCGLMGQCSKYRIVYVPGYREKTKLVYRVAQICCPGFVAEKGRCVPAPPPTPKAPTTHATTAGKSPGGKAVNTIPEAGVGRGTGIDAANRGPGNPVSGRNGATGRNAARGDTRINKPSGPGIKQGSGPWVGLGPRTPTGPDTGGGGGGGGGGGRGGGGGTGGGGTRGRGTQRTTTLDRNHNYPLPNQPVHRDKHGHSGSNVKAAYPDINVDNGVKHGADVDPGYKPRNYDPVMAFVSSATAAIGVLTLASTVLGIFLLHRRQQASGGYGGKPFGSFKLRSMGSGKSIETKVEMQTLTVDSSQEMIETPKSTQNGQSRASCPYVDIEQMRNGISEADGTYKAQLLAPNTSENNSKGTKKSRRNSGKKRSLPPEPPTYAVVRKPRMDESIDGKETRMAVTSMCGESSSLSASLEGPFTERGSAHIYAQINRKSKGVSSSWSRSSSLPSRPTTLVSNPDLQTSSSLRAIESLTRSLGRAAHKLDIRRSGCESSGYSSLQESKETLLYDTCSRREKTTTSAGGVAPAALYRSLKEKGLCGRTEYDKLSRGVKGGTQESDESILRGYATLTNNTQTDEVEM